MSLAFQAKKDKSEREKEETCDSASHETTQAPKDFGAWIQRQNQFFIIRTEISLE